MGLKAAAHEQRMAGWCIGMPCEHYVCGCESATYGVRVAAPDAGLVCELRSRSVLGLSSLVKRAETCQTCQAVQTSRKFESFF